ncbi:alpha/beta hydrolase [Acinetobacter sp. UBA3025]|uniref:alpha/beta hydrolase n=1 Tax=Acinetobacter sp. UBA3025 TaxID=1945933 RepID=UPI0025BE1EE3|nr:alpha/beta hydrolase [Acinetobacter sp. UBA3025]
MKIIYIHGMNKQKFSSASLRQRWLSLLKRGLEQSHQQAHFAYLKRHIRIPFYGDLLSRHHLHNVLNASTLMPQDWPRFPFQSPIKSQPPPHLNQYSPEICEIPELKVEDAMTFNQKLKFISILSRNTLLRDFVILLNHFPRLHDTLIKKFLIETYSYLANSTFMQQVHQRIGQQLHGDKPCILMAHSLGSVIAYHYLLLHPELNVQRFITLGSPLAFQVIQSSLAQPVVRPAAIKGDWINFYSTDDYLTAIPLTEPPFKFEPEIINHGIRTHIHRPHDITGYLLHPQVVEATLELLKNPA